MNCKLKIETLAEDEIPVEFFFVDGFGNWIVEIGKRKLPGDCTQVSPQNNGPQNRLSYWPEGFHFCKTLAPAP